MPIILHGCENEEPLRIRVIDNLGEGMNFEVSKSTKMNNVFRHYAALRYGPNYYKSIGISSSILQSIDISSLEFCFNQKLISETDTCQSLQLKEGDQIDCNTRSEILVLELLRQCESGISSGDDLMDKIKDIPRHSIHESSFVHQAMVIMTGITPLKFMKHLIRDYPGEVSSSSGLFCPHGTTQSYPLHLACYNEHCPTSIIKLLIEKYPDALGHFCVVERGVKIHGDEYGQWNGLPLHYYLSREKNIDIDTVKMLVESCPQALVMTDNDDIRSTPIFIVISNSNIKNKCEIITSLLDSDPSSVRYVDAWGRTLLASACSSGVDSSFEVVQLLFGAWPEALMIVDHRGCLPIHYLCCNSGLDDSTSIGLLHLLVSDDDATLMSIADGNSFFPIHYAVYHKSANFCKELLALCPEMVKAETSRGLPIHIAARFYRVAHLGNASTIALRHVSVIELLLKCDPSGASVPDAVKQRLPLHVACTAYYDYEYLPVIKCLFDQYPEAIWARDMNGNTPLDRAKKRKNKKDPSNTNVIDFLEDQLKYVTEDMVLDGNESTTTKPVFWSNLYKCTQDGSGSLPLHHSLRNNASLGVIKVLLYRNPGTLRATNHQGFLPIHIACQYSSVKVVKFLVEEHENDTLSLNNGPGVNSLLHYACCSGDCEKVNYLLEKQVTFVSARNSDQKLPIHLLCESRGDDESVAYVETIWRMLLANPEL